MKKSWLLLLATTLAMGWMSHCEAAVISIRKPGLVITHKQPLQAIIVDSYGNTFQQMVYYDPLIDRIIGQ